MPVQWREQMSVGVKVIDEDHRNLIDIINRLEGVIQASALGAEEREDSLRILFGRLKSYARQHFSREEGMQTTSQYVGLAENKQEHQRLIADLEELSFRYLEGKQASSPVSDAEMLRFLRRWLVDHIIKIDLKMKGHPIKEKYW